MATTLTRDVADGIVRGALHGFDSPANLAALGEDEPLRAALNLDSLDFLTFVERLSAECDRRIDEDDYPRLTTVRACVEYLVETH